MRQQDILSKGALSNSDDSLSADPPTSVIGETEKRRCVHTTHAQTIECQMTQPLTVPDQEGTITMRDDKRAS